MSALRPSSVFSFGSSNPPAFTFGGAISPTVHDRGWSHSLSPFRQPFSTPFSSKRQEEHTITTTFEGDIESTFDARTIPSPLLSSPVAATWSCSMRPDPRTSSGSVFGGKSAYIFTLAWAEELTPFSGSAQFKVWELSRSYSYFTNDSAPKVTQIHGFLARPSGSVEVEVVKNGDTPKDSVYYRVELCVTSRATPRASDRFAVATSAILQSPHPNNVCFRFPDGRTLWSNSTTLTNHSPYLKTLLSSDFSEGRKRRRLDEPNSSSSCIASLSKYDPDFEDSDCEGEEESGTVVKSDSSQAPDDGAYHEVSVTSAAYETYHALLCWIHCGHIDFAPISSSFAYPPSTKTSLPSRSAYIQNLAAKQPSLPLATSPKSLFRLADLLELDSLKELALNDFKGQLTAENVSVELFGDLSEEYDRVRDVCLTFAVQNWAKVSTSAAMLKIEEEMEQGTRIPDPKISFRLARALGKK